jgi:DNA-binding HxlR family transcriptional regulator
LKPEPVEPELSPAEICRSVGEVLDQIGDKWTVLVMRTLAAGPIRFNELARRVPGVSRKMLTATLRRLECDGFITRTQIPTRQSWVEYALTQLGRDLLGPITVLAEWAFANRGRVLEARARFSERS